MPCHGQKWFTKNRPFAPNILEVDNGSVDCCFCALDFKNMLPSCHAYMYCVFPGPYHSGLEAKKFIIEIEGTPPLPNLPNDDCPQDIPGTVFVDPKPPRCLLPLFFLRLSLPLMDCLHVRKTSQMQAYVHKRQAVDGKRGSGEKSRKPLSSTAPALQPAPPPRVQRHVAAGGWLAECSFFQLFLLIPTAMKRRKSDERPKLDENVEIGLEI